MEYSSDYSSVSSTDDASDFDTQSAVSDTIFQFVRTNDERKIRASGKKKYDAYDHVFMANAMLMRKIYSSAVHHYTEAIVLFPNEAEYYTNRGAAYFKMGMYQQAMNDFKFSVSLDPEIVRTYEWLCRGFLAFGDTTNAIVYVTELLSLNLQAHEFVKTIRNFVERWLRLMRIVNKCMNLWEHKIAHNYLKIALKFAPACSRLHLLNAECLVVRGCDTEALHEIRLVTQSTAESDFMYGMCLYLMGDFMAAQRMFRRALSKDALHIKAKEYEKKCILIDVSRRTAFAFCKQKKYKKAFRAYTRAIKIDASNLKVCAEMFYRRALVSTHFADYIDIIEDCSIVIRNDGKHTKAFLLRAWCYTKIGRFEKSVSDYRKAWNLQPTPEIFRLIQKSRKLLKFAFERRNFYAILGVTRNATQNQIETAFKKRLMYYQAEEHTESLTAIFSGADSKLQMIQEAYNALSDPVGRWSYDLNSSQPQSQANF